MNDSWDTPKGNYKTPEYSFLRLSEVTGIDAATLFRQFQAGHIRCRYCSDQNDVFCSIHRIPIDEWDATVERYRMIPPGTCAFDWPSTHPNPRKHRPYHTARSLAECAECDPRTIIKRIERGEIEAKLFPGEKKSYKIPLWSAEAYLEKIGKKAA